MKKILVGLLCSAFLTSCAPAVQSAPVQPQVGTEQVVGLSLELEHKVYDPSLTSYTYFIRNDTAETVEFGRLPHPAKERRIVAGSKGAGKCCLDRHCI